MARPVRPMPNHGAGAEWLVTKRPDPVQEVARLFVLNVHAAMGDMSVRALGRISGVDHNTLRKVLSGDGWPDMIVVAKLEIAFQRPLWPEFVPED